MPRPRTNVNQVVIRKAEMELSTIEGSGICVKLAAIIALRDNSIVEVCKVFAINRVTLYRWIQKFKESGVSNLKDKPKGHLRSKLSPTHKDTIKKWIEENIDAKGRPAKWTIKRLREEIYGEFGIEISHMPMCGHLKKMGVVLKPRASL